jgi:hypothetical protein
MARPSDCNVSKCNMAIIVEKWLDNSGELSVPNLWHNLAESASWDKSKNVEPSLLCQMTAKIVKKLNGIHKKNCTFSLGDELEMPFFFRLQFPSPHFPVSIGLSTGKFQINIRRNFYFRFSVFFLIDRDLLMRVGISVSTSIPVSRCPTYLHYLESEFSLVILHKVLFISQWYIVMTDLPMPD